MESYLRKLKQDTNAGSLATYVVIMFGMIFIMYLFGFTSLWSTYTTATVETTEGSFSLGNPVIDWGVHVVSIFAKSLELVLIGGAISVGLLLVFIFARNVAAAILPFLIPALLLIVLNIFIFPISGIVDPLFFADAAYSSAVISTGLVVFFNLFYILAVLEFIRGPH